MNFIKKECKPILILVFIFIVQIFLYRYKTYGLYIDIGREVYFPQAILEGKIMYRDLFNNFLPFSYLFNALMYKLFGSNLSTLFWVGCLNTFSIVLCLYKISREFLTQKNSTIIASLIIICCCFTTNIINYITPYAFAMTYGLNFSLIAIVCYLEYLKSDKNILLYFAFLSAGVAIANKYEFIPLLLFFLINMFLSRKKISAILKALAFGFLPVLVSFAILFLQGLSLNDLIKYYKLASIYANTDAMKEFYTGLYYFSLPTFLFSIMCLVVSVFFLYSLHKIYWYIVNNLKNKTQIAAYCVLTLSLVLLFVLLRYYFKYFMFTYLAWLFAVLLVIKIKPIIKSAPHYILFFFTLFFSVKSFWSTNMGMTYGNYVFPIVFLSTLIVIKDFYINDSTKIDNYGKTLSYFLIVYIVAVFGINFSILNVYPYKLETPKGIIYAKQSDGELFDYVFRYISKNTLKTDRIIVLPETAMLNFLFNRESDGNYNALKSEMVEAYGENNIINYFNDDKPEYFLKVMTPTAKDDFGIDYAQNLNKWIENNYNKVFVLSNTTVITLFKRK